MSVLAKILNLFLKTNQMENEMQVRFNSEYLKELPEPFHSQRESLYKQKSHLVFDCRLNGSEEVSRLND